jgi:glycosyltransferase involved in cell wall biosynthesis
MSEPRASVIVRAMDKERTIGRALESLRRQTVEPEIIVVDSGSRDRTLEIARRYTDRLIEISPEEFTYGLALNLGAAEARAPVHFALSSHCWAPSDDWIELSLRHFERPDVGGATGYSGPVPDAPGAAGVFYQDAAHFRRHPLWGFSNHGSCWRADVWREFPFNEELPAAEDKEWAARILNAGMVLAFDPAIDVSTDHRFATSVPAYFRRQRRDYGAVAMFARLPPYSLREALTEWWNVTPDGKRSRLRMRLSPWRLVDLAARYAALASASRRAR